MCLSRYLGSQFVEGTHLPQESRCRFLLITSLHSAIALAKNPIYLSEHINTRYHFIREHIANKEMEPKYVRSQDQVDDMFAKPLKEDVFRKLWRLIEITSLRGGDEN